MNDNTHQKLLQRMLDVMPYPIYIIDFENRNFHFVTEQNQYSGWGWSAERQRKLGFDFFDACAHPEDLELGQRLRKAMLDKIADMGTQAEAVAYFTIRYRSMLVPTDQAGGWMMIQAKFAPVFIDNRLKYAVISTNAALESHKPALQLRYRNSSVIETYNLEKNTWRKGRMPYIDQQEREMLVQICLGENFRSIAELMGITEASARNISTKLYKKLGVASITQAILFASDNQLFMVPLEERPMRQLLRAVPRKGKLTPDLLAKLQYDLDQGWSINAIAKFYKLNEGSIRYALRKGKLHTKTYKSETS